MSHANEVISYHCLDRIDPRVLAVWKFSLGSDESSLAARSSDCDLAVYLIVGLGSQENECKSMVVDMQKANSGMSISQKESEPCFI